MNLRRTLVALALCAPALALGAGEKKKAPAPEIPDLPPALPAVPALPEIPEIPALPDASTEGKTRIIEAQPELPKHLGPEPILVRAPDAPPPPQEGHFSFALSAALSVPGADLDLNGAYALEIGYTPAASAFGFGGRVGYSLFAAKREIMVQGRGIDGAAYQASHLIPVLAFVRATGAVESLARNDLAPYFEASAGIGISVSEVHAFGGTDNGTSVAPEVGGAVGLLWRPTAGVEAMLFTRLRSTSAATTDGRASRSFLRPSLSSTELGIAVGSQL